MKRGGAVVERKSARVLGPEKKPRVGYHEKEKRVVVKFTEKTFGDCYQDLVADLAKEKVPDKICKIYEDRTKARERFQKVVAALVLISFFASLLLFFFSFSFFFFFLFSFLPKKKQTNKKTNE